MKFIKEITPKGLLLPVTAARLAGFEAKEKAEYHTLKGAMVVLKGQMTAICGTCRRRRWRCSSPPTSVWAGLRNG